MNLCFLLFTIQTKKDSRPSLEHFEFKMDSTAKLSTVDRPLAWRGNPWTPLHSTNLNADLIELIQVLCRHLSLCEFIRTAILSCQQETFSLWSTLTSVLTFVMLPFSQWLWALGVDSVRQMFHLRLRAPWMLILCVLGSCEFLCLLFWPHKIASDEV